MKKVMITILLVGVVMSKAHAQIDSVKIANLTKNIVCTLYAVDGDNKKVKLTFETEKNKKLRAKDIEGLVLDYVDKKPQGEKEALDYQIFRYENQDSLVKFERTGKSKYLSEQYYACKANAIRGRYQTAMCGKIKDLGKGEYILIVYNSTAFVTVKFSLR